MRISAPPRQAGLGDGLGQPGQTLPAALSLVYEGGDTTEQRLWCQNSGTAARLGSPVSPAFRFHPGNACLSMEMLLRVPASSRLLLPSPSLRARLGRPEECQMSTKYTQSERSEVDAHWATAEQEYGFIFTPASPRVSCFYMFLDHTGYSKLPLNGSCDFSERCPVSCFFCCRQETAVQVPTLTALPSLKVTDVTLRSGGASVTRSAPQTPHGPGARDPAGTVRVSQP